MLAEREVCGVVSKAAISFGGKIGCDEGVGVGDLGVVVGVEIKRAGFSELRVIVVVRGGGG